MGDPVAIAHSDAYSLVTAEILTERQAQAYVFREIHGFSRHETADELGVSVSRVDNLRREAESKIEAAERTMDELEKLKEWRLENAE